ncbi:hypothetical protein SRHO_G00117390 [Serrasalmus rhombeus]
MKAELQKPEHAETKRQREGEAEDEGPHQSSPPPEELPASVRGSSQTKADEIEMLHLTIIYISYLSSQLGLGEERRKPDVPGVV